MSRPREIASYSFLVAFADGVIDAKELAFIERLALEDERVDDEERRVLSNILARAERTGLSPEVRAEIERFKRAFEIP